jgi:hypothetical protein
MSQILYRPKSWSNIWELFKDRRLKGNVGTELEGWKDRGTHLSRASHSSHSTTETFLFPSLFKLESSPDFLRFWRTTFDGATAENDDEHDPEPDDARLDMDMDDPHRRPSSASKFLIAGEYFPP